MRVQFGLRNIFLANELIFLSYVSIQEMFLGKDQHFP